MCELNWLFGLYCFSGNSLSGAYTEPENSYERRRKARSNDFLDRIDISVISTTTKSAANTTTTNKRKLTPKMNRIGKKHAKKMYDCLVTNWVHTYLLKTWILKLVWNGTIWSIIGHHGPFPDLFFFFWSYLNLHVNQSRNLIKLLNFLN